MMLVTGLLIGHWLNHIKQKGIVYKSPMYKSKTANKGKITLSFDNVPKGFKENNSIEGFYILDLKTEQWLPAQAKLKKIK
jgi:hypothetical protein